MHMYIALYLLLYIYEWNRAVLHLYKHVVNFLCLCFVVLILYRCWGSQHGCFHVPRCLTLSHHHLRKIMYHLLIQNGNVLALINLICVLKRKLSLTLEFVCVCVCVCVSVCVIQLNCGASSYFKFKTWGHS